MIRLAPGQTRTAWLLIALVLGVGWAVYGLIAEGNTADSVEGGIEAYHEAEDKILADMPNIPMWFGKVQAGHSTNVSNVVVDAFTRVRLEDVTVAGS